ncbi:hypothetical protein B9Z19DRAFT_1085327 [Tuber borchii]|uniref:Uncharacterized protein n=1 Tax=Tuber borchii TaxID=42251 RepID=A0A2T6ZR17_TUBBO|nr:hypothetical protein B9Z19DRAFT_1085327 [Tuber borchii]
MMARAKERAAIENDRGWGGQRAAKKSLNFFKHVWLERSRRLGGNRSEDDLATAEILGYS